jgi:ATP-dependent Clp protease ATP-binding subunit ClpB
METLKKSLSLKNLGLDFNDAISKFIAQKSLSEETGARSINKTIQEYIETPLSQRLLADDFPPGSTIHLTVKNGIIEAR